MKKILYTEFKYADEIIEELSKKAVIRKAITRSNLYKFWSKIAGEKFSKCSKPYSMRRGKIMVIACETPIVAQELLLRKTQLLIKFKPYAKSLGIDIEDLKFDTKKWQIT